MVAFNENQHSGTFVSIEGIDGSGKSTLARSIAQAGVIHGRPVHVVLKDAVPGDGYVAAHANGLKALLWGERSEQRRNMISDLHWLWLAASWFALMEQIEIEPRLRAGFLVVTDSWFDKILARFLLKAPEVAEQAEAIGKAMRKPDRTIFLDVSPEVAAARKQSFGYSECGNFDGQQGRDRNNFVQYQSRVRAVYRRLAGEGDWIKAEGSITVEDFERYVASSLLPR